MPSILQVRIPSAQAIGEQMLDHVPDNKEVATIATNVKYNIFMCACMGIRIRVCVSYRFHALVRT